MKHYAILYLLFPALLLPILLASCEKEIEFNGEQTEPKLVIGCFACADSLIEAEITASRFFLEGGYTFDSVTNATVAVYVNGVFVENMHHVGGPNYISTCKPGEGDELRLVVSASGFETVEAKDIFPQKTNVVSIDSIMTYCDTSVMFSGAYGYFDENGLDSMIYDTTGWQYSTHYEFKIRFNDPPGENNFYRLAVFETFIYPWMSAQDEQYNRNFLNGFDDLIFQSGSESAMNDLIGESTYNAYNIFTDDLIDGESYTITIPYQVNQYVDKNTDVIYTGSKIPKNKQSVSQNDMKVLSFDLQSISEGYYLYLKSLNTQDNATAFFAEPVQIYSNVKKGLGLLGTRSRNPIGRFIVSQ